MSGMQLDSTAVDSPDGIDSARPARRAKCGRWRCAALLLGVFAAGLVVGTAATVYVINDRFYLRSKEPQSIPERLARRLRGELDLTEAQTGQVQEILVLHMRQLMDIRRQVLPQIEAQFQAVREEVAGVLTGDQVQRWEQWFDEFRRRRRERFERKTSSLQQPSADEQPAP